jgi:GT2 family glycosyltransferase
VTGPSSTAPLATVVIINYNGRRFLDELLDSLRKQTLQDFEAVIVDNASSDDSTRYVRNNFPWVKVLAQDENLGFSRAGNLGVEQARTPYVAMLNTDIRLDPHWLEELLAVGAAGGDTAAVASKLRLYHKPQVLNGVGGCMNYLGYTWDRGMFEEDKGQYDEPADVLFASAGAALFRRSAYLEAGGFDERFFMYHEDVDLSWRLWILGLRVRTAPQAVAYHHFGASTKQEKSLMWRELMGERHNMRALLKNYELGNLRRALFKLLLLKQPRRRKYGQLQNFLWNLRHLPETLNHRRRIQKNRRRSDSELEHLIVQSPHVPVRL